jgi:hypothetical protein
VIFICEIEMETTLLMIDLVLSGIGTRVRIIDPFFVDWGFP